MTQKKSLLVVILGIVMALCLSFAVACGEKEKVTVSWDVDEHVTVHVDGQKELPKEFEKGAELKFTLEVQSGYTVTDVKAGRNTIPPKDGVYTYKATANVEIHIKAERAVTDLKVKSNPETLTYYAGETLDKTGMVVEVTYGTGETEVVTAYTVEPSVFALGDKSFTVSYGGKNATVNLNETVVGRIVLDLQGGVLSQDYKDALTANEDIDKHEADASDANKYYLYFDAALENDVPLPTLTDITRVEENESVPFLGWQSGGKATGVIPKGTDVSGTCTARWMVDLVTLTHIGYEKGTGADEGKLFLVIEGAYHMADSVYLYFYEGNADMEFKGDTYSGKRGQPFSAKFDMNELAVARTEKGENFFGKWMDIKLVAEVDGVKDTQEIDLLMYPDEGFVDTDQTVRNDEYVCSFAVHTPENSASRFLKAVVTQYVPPISLKGDESHENLVVSGTLGKSYIGKTVEIDYYGSGTVTKTATVAEDGSYSVSFPLANMPLNTTMYFHFIVKDTNGATLLQGDDDKNMRNSWVPTDDSYTTGEKLGSLDGLRTKIANADNTRVLYIGYGEWGAIVGWCVNEATAVTGVSLEKREDKGYAVISGTWDEALITKEDAQASLEKDYATPDFTNLPQLSSKGDWTAWTRTGDARIIEVEDDGTWKILLELPDNLADGQVVFVHSTSNSNFYAKDLEKGTDSITIGTKVYSIVIPEGFTDKDDTFANGIFAIKMEDSTVKSITLNTVALKVDNYANPSKVYYVVKVSVKNYTLDELKKTALGNIDSNNGERSLYAQDTSRAKAVEGEENVFELWFDVTAYEGEHLYIKLFKQEGTLEEIAAGDVLSELKDRHTPGVCADGKYAVVGGKKYTIICKDGDPYWAFPCLVVTTAAEGDTNPPETDPDYKPVECSITIDYANCKLELVGGKPTLIIKGTVTGYTAADIVLDFQSNDNWQYTIFKNAATVDADGNLTITCDLSNIGVVAAEKYYLMHVECKPVFDGEGYKKTDDKVVHEEGGKTVDLELTAEILEALGKEDGAELYAVNAGGKDYKVLVVNMWDRHMVVLDVKTEVTPETPVWQATGADIEATTDKVYFVVSGTYENYEKDALQAILEKVNYDFQKNSMVIEGSWDHFERVKAESVTVTVEDGGTWKVKFDVTALESYAYQIHFGGDNPNEPSDLKLSDTSIDGKSVELNQKGYALVNKNGSGEATDYYGLIGLRITDKSEPSYKASDQGGS